MNNKPEGNPDTKAKKVNASIVFRLNSRFLLRLAAIFLLLNLFLLSAFGILTIIDLEKNLISVVEAIKKGDPDNPEEYKYLEATGITVMQIQSEPKGFRLPLKTFISFSHTTDEGARSLKLLKVDGENLFKRLNGLVYRYQFSQGDLTYSVETHIGDEVLKIKKILLVALIVELLLLLSALRSNARMIRTTLRPIEALTEAAQSFNMRSSGFTAQKMEDLTDTLDTISADRLDTRISLDSTESELKTLAEAINSLLDRINDTYRSQIRFVSDASHELRTPIAVIEGYANLLDRWGKNDEKTLEEGITAIKDEAANMKDLIEQLLFLARGDNNTMSLQLETFDLAELAEEVLKESRMIDGGHEFEANIDSVLIRADRGLIKQALRILMDNAIKYSNPGGRIKLNISKTAHEAILSVQDEGMGISPDAVAKIFDRFFRTDQSRARATGGSGLGLAIAKWIIERHGGRIEVLSREEIGTRISFAIPVAKEPVNLIAENL